MYVNSQNIIKIREAFLKKQLYGDFYPAVYVLEPTNQCNLKCIICPHEKIDKSLIGDVDLESWSIYLQQISPYAELVMLYFMGEPTLHPRLPDLLKIARSFIRGKLVLSTNGLNLTQKVCSSIYENIDVIIFCIDRWQKTAYEEIRRGSTFSTVVNNAIDLLTNRPEGKPEVFIKGLGIILPGESTKSLDMEFEKFKEFWQTIGGNPLVGWLSSWACQFPELKSLAARSFPSPYNNSNRSLCADLWFKMIVNWQGKVLQCCYNWDYSQVVGTLPHDDLLDVWHCKQMITLRKKHVFKKFKELPLCHKCNESGDIDEFETYLHLDKNNVYKIF
ncbi:SPASM domain-containing protein [bacterium]|nr:SPASM domain-containing protein [bacterium]